MKIGIIGAGWYGAHIACVLKKAGHDVTLFEKNSEIFSNMSGKFGIRLHTGPHYPRSAKTRESCHQGFEKFSETYPELLVEHQYSIYGLGNIDADGMPPKVGLETFKSVCEESKDCHQLEKPEAWGYHNLIAAMSLKEPSIVIGKRLREIFKQRLKDADVKVVCNFEIKKLERTNGKITICVDGQPKIFDYIINATSFNALLPEQASLPFNMDVVYQPCLALVYKDKQPTERPFSFIVMDGWFPCIQPYGDPIKEDEKISRNYILTHGKWTIVGSFKTFNEANESLNSLDDMFIKKNVKPSCEGEIKRFWPEFEKRFEYIGWQGSVLAKIKSNKEFRSAVTFASDDIIYIIPGKVSNVFDAEREVLALLNKQNILTHGHYQYVQGGILHGAMVEITEKIDVEARNTCTLQPYKELHEQGNSNISKDASYTPLFFKLEDENTISPVLVNLSNHEHNASTVYPKL